MTTVRSRCGMTLLEVMLAATLLAIVTISIGTLTRLMAKASRQTSELHARERSISAGLRLLRADLFGALERRWHMDPSLGRLEIETLHRLPGEAPGLRKVLWTCSDGAVTRSAASPVTDAEPTAEPRVRHVVRFPLEATEFTQDADGVLWLTADASRAQGASPALAIPVWWGWR